MHKIIALYKSFSDKRFSTVAGTLVYFFLMSITPFMLWLTLILGKGNVNVDWLLTNKLFESVSPFLRYLKASAESAANGAGVILLATTLYSSTNFFYHLRRSGEIIYGSDNVKGGIKLRLISLVIILLTYTLAAMLASVYLVGFWLLKRLMPKMLTDFIVGAIITALAFTATLLLNIFACPYKLKLKSAVPGSLLTTGLWIVCIIGFNVYTVFATPEKLYGKIASVIVFLLWCYVMMCCFVLGIIYNGTFIKEKVLKTLY